jgi:hypothetical protein
MVKKWLTPGVPAGRTGSLTGCHRSCLYLLLLNRFFFLHFYRQQHTAFLTDTLKADAGPGKWKIGSP